MMPLNHNFIHKHSNTYNETEEEKRCARSLTAWNGWKLIGETITYSGIEVVLIESKVGLLNVLGGTRDGVLLCFWSMFSLS